ncbi:amino acid/polyamine transporter I [Clohesyomyces aquaticus]|uniref:Amino acid/polyamine transporter I n=1 Tax=Clohesyomyces aquaticus TaxID=1231657 RepID=A0A1Y1ZXH9_9PLEO|nr:amino acid/polyamine transporter I [Clohesyomyces aquaticus]
MESPHEPNEREGPRKVGDGETSPLLGRRSSDVPSRETARPPKQLSTRHAFAVLVSIQIGSGIFASPAQVDSNVPSPGAALLIWVLGGLLSWAGAASFAELGAALPLNGGTQEYLRRVYGDTMAFLMGWIYIMAVKPSSMAIQSIVIAESIGSVTSATPLPDWKMKVIAASAFISMIIINSINTKTTIRLSESFTVVKITAVLLVVFAGLAAVLAHLINPSSSLSGSKDWYTKDWFAPRPSVAEGKPVDWKGISTWDRFGHYTAAIYAGLWAYDGWDNANFVASEIKDPGRALPRAIKAAMAVVLSCYELVNIAYYILLPWDTMSASDAVAVAAAKSLLGRPAGIVVTILVAISCAGSITSNIFSVGRLTVAASQHHYLPGLFSQRGIPSFGKRSDVHPEDEFLSQPTSPVEGTPLPDSIYDAPINANILALFVTLVYVFVGNFRALLTFVSMAMWVFYVSTVVGLLILRRREPELHRPYRALTLLPIVFVVVGSLVIARSAIFAPFQSGGLATLLFVGSSISHFRGRLQRRRE